MYKPPLGLNIHNQETFDASFQNLLDYLEEDAKQILENPPDRVMCLGCHHDQAYVEGFYRCEKCNQSDKGGLCFHANNPGWVKAYLEITP